MRIDGMLAAGRGRAHSDPATPEMPKRNGNSKMMMTPYLEVSIFARPPGPKMLAPSHSFESLNLEIQRFKLESPN